ncbi:MAG: IS200/IS605 family transposase [Thiomargarita sp.]|nr:IS200/IS605 family transposase [Thiomargarita sp.]
MSTYTQILYQIVFSTKNREFTLVKKGREKLFRYIWGILKNKNCHLYQINGVENHIHILTSLHSSIALANLVKDIKVASSKFIKENQVFPNFGYWQNGYGAFTYSYNAKDNLITYIRNQEEHHKNISFLNEYKILLKEFEIEFEEKHLL